ncbi:unnamed protein product [Symbiodinium pilosum]|uniref:Uncharacterized protein n=1 Tax=Symbiodinium pilosum TaxID=2952 RepID=A0A812X158_SYMPI|nr:unnamed protein product [Symbiodinium pilosum]
MARRPIATWVDDLGPPVVLPDPIVVHVSPADVASPWVCQICSERGIPPSLASCPTCKRSRGTELRRSYMTATELTESVVSAVNEGRKQSAGNSFKARRGTSPVRDGLSGRGRAGLTEGQAQVSQAEAGAARGRGGRVTFCQDGLNARSGGSNGSNRHSFGASARVDAPPRALRPLIAALPEASGRHACRHPGLTYSEPPAPCATCATEQPSLRGSGPGLPGPPLSHGGALTSTAPATFSRSSGVSACIAGAQHAKSPASQPQKPDKPKTKTGFEEFAMPAAPLRESASAPSIRAEILQTRAKKQEKREMPDVDMDIQSVLEAQKRRIEGLKNRLNMTIA